MLKKRIKTLFLIACLIFATVPAVLGAEVTVSPTSGSNAQTAINDAINSVATGATPNSPGVVLLTAGTYEINGPINLKSNVVLKGAGDDTIIFATDSVCNSAGEPAYIFGSGVSNAEVSDLQFKSSASEIGDGGHGDFRNCIQLSSSSDCKVHDILFTKYLYSDGVRISKSSGIQVYNCRMHSAGHDGIEFLSGSHDCHAYNNDIEIMVNCGIRVDNGENIEVDHNTMSGDYGSGWCIFEMEDSLSNINIHNNILHDYHGSSGNSAVESVHASGSVSVNNNVLWNVGSINMGTSTNNIVNPSDQNVESWVAKGYGYGSINAAPTTTTSDSTNANSQTDTSNQTDKTAQQPKVADISSNVTSGEAPLGVQFTSKTAGNPTDYYWTFVRSDGYKGDDWNSHQAVTAKHTFTEAGTYTVSLTVSNASGNNTVTKENYITVK